MPAFRSLVAPSPSPPPSCAVRRERPAGFFAAIMIVMTIFGARLLSPPLSPGSEGPEKKTLRCGWYLWDPYQFEEKRDELTFLTGLDVNLIRAIFKDAGYSVSYDEVSWAQHQIDIREGARDIAAGTFVTAERRQYAWFSEPYRKETDVLFMRAGESSTLKATSLRQMLEGFRRRKFRLGVVAGFYYGPEMNAWITGPANTPYVVPADNDYVNLKRLLEGHIDGFLADRLAGATMAYREGLQSGIEAHPMPVFSADLAVMFSKRTTSPAVVAAFNRSLRKLRDSGGYDAIVRGYLVPVLLAITVHRPWFLFLDLVGTVAFAVSGVLLARKERYDIIGAFVLAALPAAGGGVLRDVITDRNPIGLMRTPSYLLAIIGVVVVGTLIYKAWDAVQARYPQMLERKSLARIQQYIVEDLFQATDAIGLAAFTVVGVVVAVETRCSPLWLWGPLLAAITGAGGGILRDIARADVHSPSLKGRIYPEIALAWGFLFSMFLLWETHRQHLSEVLAGVIVTIVGALITRWLVIHLGAQSIFLYDHRRAAPSVVLSQIEALQAEWLGDIPRLLGGIHDGQVGSGGFDIEACYNECAAGGARAREMLTLLTRESLPEADLNKRVTLEIRQHRFSSLLLDVRAFAECAEKVRQAGLPEILVHNLVEALDAIMNLAGTAFRTHDEIDAGTLVQATSSQGEKLVEVRRKYLALISSADRDGQKLMYQIVGLFERAVSQIRAAAETLAGPPAM